MSHKVREPNNPSPTSSMVPRDGRYRKNIIQGSTAKIIQKKDQREGTAVEGRVREILTNSSFHPHGIKVRLEDGRVGRVREVCPER